MEPAEPEKPPRVLVGELATMSPKEQIKMLQNEVNEVFLRYDAEKTRRMSLQRKLNEANEKNQIILEENALLEEENATLLEECRELNDAVSELSTDNASLQQELKHYISDETVNDPRQNRGQVRLSEEELSEATAAVQTLKKECEDARTAAAVALEEKQKLEAVVCSQTVKLDQLKRRFQLLEKSHAVLTERAKGAEKKTVRIAAQDKSQKEKGWEAVKPANSSSVRPIAPPPASEKPPDNVSRLRKQQRQAVYAALKESGSLDGVSPKKEGEEVAGDSLLDSWAGWDNAEPSPKQRTPATFAPASPTLGRTRL